MSSGRANSVRRRTRLCSRSLGRCWPQASTIVEAFFRGQEGEFVALPEHRLVQLHCEAPLAVLLERFASRTRHAAHPDAEKIKELSARFESGAHSPLNLAGDLITLDTNRKVDEETVTERIRALL